MGNLRYEEWMDLLCLRIREGSSSQIQDDELSQKVRQALGRLEPEEKEALELFHFLGRPVDEISDEMKLTRRGVERQIRCGTLKLRRLLAEYVQARFGIRIGPRKSCPICDAENRAEAEALLLSKSAEETWRRIIRELRQRLKINVTSPQTLVGHIKYHRFQNPDNK